MTSKLGVYWSVMHRRPQDYDYFRRLQPTVFKIMDGGPPDYQFARDNLLGSIVIARDWALSEQHADMLKDPVGTGQRHAREWDNHQRRLGFDRANTLILGINEPRVWDAGVPEALRQYTIALCEEATKYGLRVGAMQLSVGWPNNDGPDTPPNWTPWHGVDNAIRHNRGALVLHEYWADRGPLENWGWWAGRALKCPWQVPIVIGECGVDMFVKDGSVSHLTRGWRGRTTPDIYAHELVEYTERMSVDPRFLGCAVFASDYANGEWASFDVEPAYNEILAIPIDDVQPTPPPDADPTTAYVIAPNGARIRAEPNTTSATLALVPYGERVQATDFEGTDASRWFAVRHQDASGWMRGDLLGLEPPPALPQPEPTPEPEPPSGDCWSRAWPIVLKIEGGLSLDPNDTGNYYDGKLVGTKYGISAAVWGGQYDIPNLTKEQALDIYKRHYFDASGAGELPWPMCLIVFDTAINHGVGVAKHLLDHEPTPEEIYLGQRALRYFEDPKWRHFGIAWGNRVEHLDDIVDGEIEA